MIIPQELNRPRVGGRQYASSILKHQLKIFYFILFYSKTENNANVGHIISLTERRKSSCVL